MHLANTNVTKLIAMLQIYIQTILRLLLFSSALLLTACDSDPDSDNSSIVNSVPIASISISPDPESTMLTTEMTITLNGGGSHDPNSDELFYTWSQPHDQSIDLSSIDAVSTSFITDEADTYTFTLSVSDGELESDIDSIVRIYSATIPADFAAVASDTQVTLNWTPYSNNTIYNIYRSIDTSCDLDNYITACSSTAGALFSNVTSNFIDSELNNETTYYYWIESYLNGATHRSDRYVEATPWQAKFINDTGIYIGGDYSIGNNTGCSSNVSAPQDCQQGRDATHNDDTDGHAGFSFTKLDSNGNDLAAEATDWFCVRDNVTNLIWEVKTDDNSEYDRDKEYRWGGYTAIGRSSPDREGDYYDDWNALINAANSDQLCGFDDWRVPNRKELRSIVNYGNNHPSIDHYYFPNTVSSRYWSASPLASEINYAQLISFSHGNDSDIGRLNEAHVRLVRSD